MFPWHWYSSMSQNLSAIFRSCLHHRVLVTHRGLHQSAGSSDGRFIPPPLLSFILRRWFHDFGTSEPFPPWAVSKPVRHSRFSPILEATESPLVTGSPESVLRSSSHWLSFSSPYVWMSGWTPLSPPSSLNDWASEWVNGVSSGQTVAPLRVRHCGRAALPASSRRRAAANGCSLQPTPTWNGS